MYELDAKRGTPFYLMLDSSKPVRRPNKLRILVMEDAVGIAGSVDVHLENVPDGSRAILTVEHADFTGELWVQKKSKSKVPS